MTSKDPLALKNNSIFGAGVFHLRRGFLLFLPICHCAVAFQIKAVVKRPCGMPAFLWKSSVPWQTLSKICAWSLFGVIKICFELASLYIW